MSEPDSGPARVGVRDVARVAGVSAQTVSRVINDHPRIREETRRRVQDAMAQLDYRVNNAARALGTRTSRTLGLIVSDATLYGPAVAVAEIESAARQAGRWVATAYADAADAASVRAAALHLRDQGVDGLIVVASHTRSARALADLDGRLPVELFHAHDDGAAQQAAAALVVEYLAALGHRRVARLGGPPDWLDEIARAAGYRAALTAHGVHEVAAWTGDWSAAAGAAVAPVAAAAIRETDGPTAIVCANDQLALGLVAGLAASGISVPGDVSVAGFDDNPDAAYYRPALTTVRLDIGGEARRSVAAVLAATVEPERDAPVYAVSTLPPALVTRGSTAPPPRIAPGPH
ncbi:LacI family transcriptional regulator [Microbacterium sp. cx-55]|uniref:LacI family DNA-binding transcriptional regulator n=1 Tax=Microbacterium sp. cx-55 TaxID=2875948 RepID=UPI001CBCB9B0|nr:LacI family DNA-binding transcriptional regulator [Microbacterium sp. cx-55]MBZ4487662.1 LacI family transcriptional regulator [Microbacterium sp. cx-55]UGB35674.1 LacI family transcriptional regulator [Microbacterium sp. cx-55]